jgi:hypothetical protein
MSCCCSQLLIPAGGTLNAKECQDFKNPHASFSLVASHTDFSCLGVGHAGAAVDIRDSAALTQRSDFGLQRFISTSLRGRQGCQQ